MRVDRRPGRFGTARRPGRADHTRVDSGTGTARPHDVLTSSDWKQAFKNAAEMMSVSRNDAGFKRIRAICSSTSGLAVADGRSVQPFDSDVHGGENALERHQKTAGQEGEDEYATYSAPSIGRVTVAEYRGKDLADMEPKQVKAAMRARAKIAIAHAKGEISSMFGKDKGFTDLVTEGDIESIERALELAETAKRWIIANKCR